MQIRTLLVLLTWLIVLQPSNGYTQSCVVSIVAGSDNANGEGAQDALNFPTGLAIDKNGNIYFSDQASNLIKKISPQGNVTLLAGTRAFGNKDGTGSGASFDIPDGLAIDTEENIIVADAFNNLIRKITPEGVVTTIAGTTQNGSQDGPASMATFNFPTGIAIDNDENIYVADSGNNKIRKITPSGIVSTIAGSGIRGREDGQGIAASFDEPIDITIDMNGNLFVADRKNHLIRKISPLNEVSTFAGQYGVAGYDNGLALNASFYFPFGLSTDRDNNIYVADHFNNQIRKITQDGVVSTVAGSGVQGNTGGPPNLSTFFGPSDVAVHPNGDIYVADRNNHLIRKISCAEVSANIGTNCIDLDITAFLEGPYEQTTGKMTTHLNDLGYLPGQLPTTFFSKKNFQGQPYFNAPWYHNGNEDITQGYEADVTDWVLISIKAEKDDIANVCSVAGLLHSNGSITFPNSSNCCRIDPSQSYYVVIEHRNHLLAMSSNKIPVRGGQIEYDFTTQNSYAEELGFGQKEVAIGVFALYAGNNNQENNSTEDIDINMNDLNTWWDDVGKNSGYYFSDLDLNGDININDKSIFLKNVGVFSDVVRD